jgi:glutathione synthase/RimK-type ligase-like ATP-grasp enzyme
MGFGGLEALEALECHPLYIKHDKFVVLPNRGLGGRGLVKINGRESLRSFLESQAYRGDLDFVIRPFYSPIRDLRVYWLDGDFLGPVERIPAKGDFRGNRMAGGTWSLVESLAGSKQLREELSAYSGVVQELGIKFAAFDFIIYENQIDLLELNLRPGLKFPVEQWGERVIDRFFHSLVAPAVPTNNANILKFF